MTKLLNKQGKLCAPPPSWLRRSLVGMLSLAAATLVSTNAQAGTALSGTYTVCTSGCDYSTVQAAANDLMANGVSGPTIIHIKSGDYNEQVKMTSTISGASSSNTITFQGDGKYGTGRTHIYYADYETFIVKYGKYITFDNMFIEATASAGNSYPGGGALELQACDHTHVNNCLLVGKGGNYYDYGMYAGTCSNDVYENNRIEGGFYNNSYDYNVSSSLYGKNDTVRNNVMVKGYQYNYYGYYGNGNQIYKNRMDSIGYQYGYSVFSDYESGCSYYDNVMTGKYYTFFLAYPNGPGTSQPFMIYNNFMSSTGYYVIYSYDFTTATNINTHILHNTFYHSYGGGNTVYLYNYYASSGWDIRNNNFYNTSSASTLLYIQNFGNANDVESGNNFYNANSGGNVVSINGVNYKDVSTYMTAVASKGLGHYDQSVNTTFKNAPLDLHYTSTTLPWGKNAGINTDFDGDKRCSTFPTAGADEGSANWSTPTSSFTGPKDSIFDGFPAVFKNSAGALEPKSFKWYVDGKFVSDSIDLSTTALKYPSSTVSLVTFNCGGKDSAYKTYTVYAPHKAPVTDFISNLNLIRAGQVVKFTDLTDNYPSSWAWDITPKTAGTTSQPTFGYAAGDSTRPNIEVRFTTPGKYKVCLTTSNSKGSGGTECKSNYIQVLQTYNLGNGVSINDTRGYLYDNGGPNANYTSGTYNAVIAPPCNKAIYLVFTMFDTYCGYDYVRLWDGGSIKTAVKELTTCTANNQYGVGPGLTGGPSSSCNVSGVVCTPKVTDTFVATSGKMFIQMVSNQGNRPGFEAYFWSDPKVDKAPVAGFSAPDTVCTNGSVSFVNTSQGEDLSYEWDFDGDYSYFEDTHANTTWGFPFNGPQTITLIVNNCAGADTFQKTIYVKGPPKPKVAFHADNVNPTTNDIIYLIPDISQCVDAYSWKVSKTFGSAKVTYVNGTNSLSMIPQVTLGDTGCYTVNLYAENATGNDQLTKQCYIFVKNPYCLPNITTSIPDLGISEVQLNGMDHKSQQTGGYENYVPTANASVEIGITYPITISRSTTANSASRAVYIDWNADGDFNDTMEVVAVENSGNNASWTDSFTVPAFAKVGATVMRIAITKGGKPQSACGNTYGEYEDYRLYISRDKTKPVITMLGADTIKVEQGYAFTDPGATAFDNMSGNITKRIKVTKKEISTGSTFDNTQVGTYVFTYTVQDDDGNSADPKTRIVIVTPDKTPPAITVNSADTVKVGIFTTYQLPTYSAYDLLDGNVTGDVHVSNPVPSSVLNDTATYVVSFTVSDASGNTATKNIIVKVADTSAPVLHLIGANTVYHDVNTAYTDSGVTYTDNYYKGAQFDSIMRSRIQVFGNVDVSKIGTYSISYSLTDPSGNKSATVTRTVIVQDTIAPKVSFVGKQTDTVEVNIPYYDLGIHISDNYYYLFTVDTSGTFFTTFKDGVPHKLGLYTIIYKVTDGSGNVTVVTRKIYVADRTAPVVTLIGNAVVNICRWQSYTDSGYTVSDNYWNKSKITVTKEGTFLADSTQKEGGFYIRYKAVDSSGNVGYSEKRIIFVAAPGTADCSSSIAQGKDIDRYVTIYPNPSEGLFTVSSNLPQQKHVRITVSNMLGQQVAVISNQVLGNNQFQIDLRGQAAGVYLVNIYTDKQVVTKRITITK